MQEIELVNINQIRVGDVIIFDDKMRTLTKSNFKRCGFMGSTIYGDSYQLGLKPVQRVKFLTTKGIKCLKRL